MWSVLEAVNHKYIYRYKNNIGKPKIIKLILLFATQVSYNFNIDSQY